MKVQPTTQQLIAMLYERLPELFDRTQRKPLTAEDVRKAGGIVHGDGNIFFTNINQLNEAVHGIKGNA